ncbi:MAG: hypothetical protein ACE5R6_11060 [Candidatus Heimdallarchaeota archaeon]
MGSNLKRGDAARQIRPITPPSGIPGEPSRTHAFVEVVGVVRAGADHGAAPPVAL